MEDAETVSAPGRKPRQVKVRFVNEPGSGAAEAVARYLLQREQSRPQLEVVKRVENSRAPVLNTP